MLREKHGIKSWKWMRDFDGVVDWSDQIFSRKSKSTITNIRLSVCLFVHKPPVILHLLSFIHHFSSFIFCLSSIIFHPASFIFYQAFQLILEPPTNTALSIHFMDLSSHSRNVFLRLSINSHTTVRVTVSTISSFWG